MFTYLWLLYYRKVTLAILGLDNAGKTVTAKSLSGGKVSNFSRVIKDN